jgi:hypothetical protein
MHFSFVEREVFDVSTKMVVGDGETALFWVDKWLDGTAIGDIAPDLVALIPKHVRKRCTVREALVKRRWIIDIQGATSSLALWQYVQLWIRVRDVQLLPMPDKLLWRWMMDAQYSSKSCYEFLFLGAIISRSRRLNWRSCPPSRGSSSTSGWLANINVGPERDWRRGGTHTHLAAHSMTGERDHRTPLSCLPILQDGVA